MKLNLGVIIATGFLSFSGFVSATIINPAGYTDALYLSGGGSYGSMAHANNGDVYYSKNGVVYKTDGTSNVSIGNGLGLEIIGNNLYIGGIGNNSITKYDLTTSATSVIGNIINSAYINSIALAPNAFLGNPDTLIIGTNSGIYNYNLLNSTSSKLGSRNSPVSDVLFNNSGDLLGVYYSSSGAFWVDSNGNESSVGNTIGFDGLANHSPTGDIFIANSLNDQIDVLHSNNTFTQFASQTNFNAGWYPSPLSFNSDYTKLYYADGNDIRVISGFTGLTNVSAPSMIGILAFGIITLLVGRFKSKS